MVELRKSALGFFQVYGIMVGIMVAASTIAFIPIGWDIAGPAFIVSMVIAAVNALIVGLNFCELALMFPRASSFIEYFTEAFGEWAGVGLTALYLIVLTLAGGGSFVVIGDFLSSLMPVLPWWAWGLIFYAALLLLNYVGVVVFGWSELIMTVLMIGSLILVSLLALVNVTLVAPDYAAMSPFLSSGGVAILHGAVFGVWLFVGFEVAGPLVEEIRDPRRTIPLALVACIGTVFVAKALFFVAEVTTTEDMSSLVGLPGPQIETGLLLFGGFGVIWLTLVSIIAEGSSVNSAIGANGRLLYGLGLMKAVPELLGQLHPRFRTPASSLIVITAAMVILGLAAGLENFLALFLLATFMWLTTYFLFCLAVIVLRLRAPALERPFSVGGPSRMPALSVLGLLIMVVTFAYSPEALSLQGLALLVLCCLYGVFRQWRDRRARAAA